MAGHDDAWTTPLPRSRGDRLRALAPAVLLVAIASLGVHRSVTLDQSSWQGASFGMFATYDNATSRAVRVYVDGPEGAVRVRLPADLQDDTTRLRVTPTDGAAGALARATLAGLTDDRATAVRVEVWRIRVQSRDGDLSLRTELLTSGEAQR